MVSPQKQPTSLCGGCTVCCRLLEVEVPGGLKPKNTPCRWLHKPESGYSGCSIYPDRPPACQKFECHYIKLARRRDLTTSPDIRPDKSGVMIVHLPSRLYFVAHVFDPMRRSAWEQMDPPMHAVINQLCQEGYKVIISWGAGDRLLLQRDGEGGIKRTPLPPEQEEIPDGQA